MIGSSSVLHSFTCSCMRHSKWFEWKKESRSESINIFTVTESDSPHIPATVSVQSFTCFLTNCFFSSTWTFPLSSTCVHQSIQSDLLPWLPAHLHHSLSRLCLTPTTCTSAFVLSFPRQVFFSLFLFSFASLVLLNSYFHTSPIFCPPVNSDFCLISSFPSYSLELFREGGIVCSTSGALLNVTVCAWVCVGGEGRQDSLYLHAHWSWVLFTLLFRLLQIRSRRHHMQWFSVTFCVLLNFIAQNKHVLLFCINKCIIYIIHSTAAVYSSVLFILWM